MSVHEATFECFAEHLNGLVERMGQAAPGTPLPDSMPELCDETMVVQSQDLTNNPELLRLLQAIATVSESNSGVINAYVEGMVAWREAQLASANRLEIVSPAVSHIVEVLFGATVLRILLVPGCSDALHDRLRDQLEEIASAHLLGGVGKPTTLPSSRARGAGTTVAAQMRFGQRDICDPTAIDTADDQFSFHELYFPDTRIWVDSAVVAEVSARIIGVLSDSKLGNVTARFLPKLEAAVRMTATKDKVSRQSHEGIEIARALRYVRLGVQQLDYSVDFLTKVVTLMEQQRLPMELRHELCALLISCLERIPTNDRMRREVKGDGNSSSSPDRKSLEKWDEVVSRTYRKISEWVTKPKHLAASCRALAALVVSFSAEAGHVEHVQALVQLFVKHCSDSGSLRNVVLASFRAIVRVKFSSPVVGFVSSALVQAIEFGLVHLAAEIFRRPDSKSKGKGKDKEDGYTLTVAQLDLLVEAAVLFGARDRGRATHTESSGLKFVIEKLVLPSLDHTQESGQRTDEMQLQFGMRTFIGIYREYEALLSKRELPKVTAFNPKVLMEPSLQRYARKIGPHFSTLMTHYTGEVVRQADAQPGSSLPQMVITLIDCIPRVIPRMPYDKLQNCLVVLALGTLKDIRDAGLACFVRFVHIWPPLRLIIVRAFCDAIVRHTDSGSTRHRDETLRAIRSLKRIVDEWAMLGNFTRRPDYGDGSVGTFHGIRQDWAEGAENETASAEDHSKPTVVIETTALYLLCSTHPEIRSYGFELLQSSHDLEERLAGETQGVVRRLSTIQILEHAAPVIIERASVGAASQRGFESSSGTFSQLVGFAGVNQGLNDLDQRRWCRCLAEVCTFVAALRFDVASSFCQLAAQAAKATGPSVQGRNTQIHKWCNYTVAALSSLERKTPEGSWQKMSGKMSDSDPLQEGLIVDQEGLIADLMEMVKTVLYSSNATHRSVSVFVLGLVSHSVVYDAYCHELVLLNAVSMDLKQKPAKDSDALQQQLRVDLMSLHRMIAERIQPSASEEENKIDHLLSFIESTVAYSNSTMAMNDRGALFELATLRVDFCLIVRYVAKAAYDGGLTKFTSDVRTRTFKLVSEWCAYGMTSGVGLERRQAVDAEHHKRLEQIDDLQKRRELVNRYRQEWARLETAANHALCCLFWGTILEDSDPDLIFRWGKHVFQNVKDPTLWDPMLDALEKHLVTTPILLPKYVDHCYETGELLGKESTQLLYFNAITEACSRRTYSEQSDLAALWVLALYHTASTSQVIRHAAALLLRVLIGQIKSESGLGGKSNSATMFAALVPSKLPDTFESQSKLLSSQLADMFPEFSRNILLETFRRLAIRVIDEQPAGRLSRCNKMLAILAPWMQKFVLGDYRKVASPSFSSGSVSPVDAGGSPSSDVSELLSTDSKDLESSQILNCIFSLTQSLGAESSHGIQLIWESVVANRAHNAVPVIVYCIDKVADTYENDPEAFFVQVAQQIVVVMARCHVDLTVSTLMDQVSMLPETPSARVSRSNVATILLIEIIHERSFEHFRDHTPLLLHMAIIGMDHDDENYAEYCSHLLINLLQTMVLKALADEEQCSKHSAACSKATQMIQFLKSRDAQDTWRDGDDMTAPGAGRTPPAELQWAIECIVDSMDAYAVPDLRLRWSNLALQYPLLDRRADIVTRSHQIFRFLRHEIQLQHARQLLFASHAYCHVGRNGTPFLAETAATIECVMHRPEQLERHCMLFPQFFWFAAALCQSDAPVVYISGLRLFRAVLPTYTCNDAARHSLQAGLAASESWSRPFRGVQELVMRGLSTAQTEEHSISTLRLLLSVSLMNSNDNAVARSRRTDGLTNSSLAVQLVAGLLPWLCYHLEEANTGARRLHPDASSTARDVATFCDQRGLQMLAPSFADYAESPTSVVTSDSDCSAFLTSLSEPLREAMAGVGIAGRIYGPWLAHLGEAPAGLHARRYAKQVLQILLTVLGDGKHLLASQMTSAEQEAVAQSGQGRDGIPQDAILPLLIKRASEFAAVRDLSEIAVQVLSAASLVEEQLADTDKRRPDEESAQNVVDMHALDRLAVGKVDQFDEALGGSKGTVVKAWSADQSQGPYLSLHIGDEVVLTPSQRVSSSADGSRSWSTGFIARRRTSTGLLVPLTNTAEGSFPTECVKLNETSESSDTHNDIHQQAEDESENYDTAKALFAICRTLPGSIDLHVIDSSVPDGAATCDEHALWLEPPIVISSDQSQRINPGTRVALKPRFISVAVPAGRSTVQRPTRAGRGPTSEVRYQSSNHPAAESPERSYGDRGVGYSLYTNAGTRSPVPSVQDQMRIRVRTKSSESEEQQSMSIQGHARTNSAASVSNSSAGFERPYNSSHVVGALDSFATLASSPLVRDKR